MEAPSCTAGPMGENATALTGRVELLNNGRWHVGSRVDEECIGIYVNQASVAGTGCCDVVRGLHLDAQLRERLAWRQNGGLASRSGGDGQTLTLRDQHRLDALNLPRCDAPPPVKKP
jgi:hypothetical protein